MSILRKFNLVIFLLLISVNITAQETTDEKFELFQNYLILGSEEKGIQVGIELISLDKHKSVREKTLFTLAEYYFTTGIIQSKNADNSVYTDNIQYLNNAYSLYLKIQNDYKDSKLKEVVEKRIKFLEDTYETALIFRDLYNQNENERVIAEKKINFMNLFIIRDNEMPYLFFRKGEDIDTYELMNKYLDDIIVNSPDYGVYAYYDKLLAEISRRRNIEIIRGRFEDKSFPQVNYFDDKVHNYRAETYDKNEIINNTENILNTLIEKYPNHPLTIRAILVAVSYFIKDKVWDYNGQEVKKWLEIAIKNDEDKLGIKFLLTKEYLLKTNFKEK